jgi:hypothetical protein
MLLFDEAKKVLNKYGHNYLDGEIKIIREFISTLVEIDFNLFKRRKEEEIEKNSEVKLIPLKIDYETKSDPLHQGEYRRAS